MPIKKRLNNIILFNRKGIYYRDETDTSPDIFRVTEFPTRFTAGKNVVKIQGNANSLAPGAFIEIEVTDANGDPIYTEMLNYLEDDGSRAISIFIYPQTAEGDARLTLGTEINRLNGQPIPDRYRGKINTIWSKTIPVTPTVNNNSEIIFVEQPTVTIEETIGVHLDRLYSGSAQTASYSVGKVEYYERNNDAKLLITDGQFVSDMKGGTVTVANPVNPTPVPNFTLPNPPAYTSTIKKVLNNQVISLDTPFTFLTSQSLSEQRFTEFQKSNYVINFNVSPEYLATQNSQSFALMQVKNLDPAAGAVSRLKLYASNNGTVGDYELINDIDLTPTEIFVDATGSITPDLSIGFFTSQSIIDTFWEAQKWNGVALQTAPILTWQTSSLNNAINVAKTIDPTEIGDIQILKVKDAYNGTFIKDSQYKVQFDAIATRLTDDPKISIYMSGSAFAFDDDILNKTLGRNIGKKVGELTTTANEKRYDDKSFIFDADMDGTASLIIVIEKGQWQFSEIQTTSDALFGFSENYTRLRTLVPIAHKSGNQVSFKLEYYNISGAKSKTVTFINDEGFAGGNRYIDGDFSMLTGSLTVADSLRSGVEIVGLRNTGYVRSLGYEGFNQATGSSPGGFLLFSGSALPEQTETTYQGVGLELVSNANNYFRYRTNPSILDVHTETFFLGNPAQQFVSGSNGQLEISSSGYHFRPNGEVTASGGFIFGDKASSQYIQYDGTSLVVRGNLSVDQIFTPALINGAPSNITNASSSITAGGFAKFVSASIGGWAITTSSIEGGNLLMKPEGILQTRDFATGVKGWKISSEANGTAEFENVRIRGTLRTTTFEKESVNAVGGQVFVANSTTITGSDVPASATTMSVKNASGFAVGEIVLAKKVDNTGFQTEYLLLQSASLDSNGNNEDETYGRIYVERAYGDGTSGDFVGDLASAAQTYTDGQVIVSTGKIGTGFIKLNANPNDQATPYMDIVERTGSGLYDVGLKARIGDLSGITDTDFTNGVTGYGIYTENGYFKGKIELANTSDINIPGNTIYKHGPLPPHPRSAGTPSNDLLPNATWIEPADNAIELVTGPMGGQELAITCYPDAPSGPDGGFNSDPFPIDSGSGYMFVTYIKRTHAADAGSSYFGCYGLSGSVNGYIFNNATSPAAQSNPYFFAGDVVPATETSADALGRWFLHVGYVYPAGTEYDATRESVVYDLTTGLTGSYNSATNKKSYIWKQGATHGRIRVYHYYNGLGDGNTKYQEIARPTVYKMDGTEPTIQSLLSNVSRGGNTVIDGSSITTGNVRSTNLSTTAGTELALDTGVVKIGGTGAYTSNNGILLDGPAAKFAVGNASGNYVRFNHTANKLEINTDNFDVDAAGNVSMTGTITANAGNIGGFNISDDAISSTNLNLVLSGSGKITASDGNIGGFELDATTLRGGQYTETITSQSINNTLISSSMILRTSDGSAKVSAGVSVIGSAVFTSNFVNEAEGINSLYNPLNLISQGPWDTKELYLAVYNGPAVDAFRKSSGGGYTQSNIAPIEITNSGSSNPLAGIILDDGWVANTTTDGETEWTGIFLTGSGGVFPSLPGSGTALQRCTPLVSSSIVNHTFTRVVTPIRLDSANRSISINTASFGADGIQMEVDSNQIPKFFAGKQTGSFFKYDGNDLAISGSNFQLTEAGDLTGRDMNLDGFTRAKYFVYNLVKVKTGNSGSYLQEYTKNSQTYLKLVLDGSLGGEIAQSIRIQVAPMYPIGMIQPPSPTNSAGHEIVIESSVGGTGVAYACGVSDGANKFAYSFWGDSDDWFFQLFQCRNYRSVKYPSTGTIGDIGVSDGRLMVQNVGQRFKFVRSAYDFRLLGISSYDTTNGNSYNSQGLMNFYSGIRTSNGPIGIGIGGALGTNKMTAGYALEVDHITDRNGTSTAKSRFHGEIKVDGGIQFADGTTQTTAGGGGGGGGSGNVSNTGTPANNQVAVWTNATTIEGDSDLTFDGNKLSTPYLCTGRLGTFGTYNSSQVQGIWSIGAAYYIDTAADDFGNHYGMGYAYSTNGGAPLSGEHQILFVNNGTVNTSIGCSGNAKFGGNVGIGITPTYPLHVSGNALIAGTIYLNDTSTLIQEASSGNTVRLQSAAGYVEIGPKNSGYSHFYTDRTKYYFDHQIVVDEGIVASYDEDLSLRRANSTNDSINIGSTQINFYLDGNEDMRLENDGDLHVDGNVVAYSTTVSDSRLKDNIITLGSAVNTIKSLRGVSYTWNAGSKKGKRDLGLIAQEVQEILPEIVTETTLPLVDGVDDTTSYKTIDYEKIIPILVEAVKEQQDQIDKLTRQLNKIKK